MFDETLLIFLEQKTIKDKQFPTKPKIHITGTYVCSFLNSWFVVCITFENYIVTFHLKMATSICSVQKARLVVLLLVLFALAFFDFSIWTTTVTEYAGSPLCTQVVR
jgi:hypothetical protein